jgi:DNA repair protein RecO
MQAKTRGIVLHAMTYNDRYSIVHIYTETFGRVSYMVARSKGKKSNVSKSLFMPLSVLDMEVEHQNKRDIHRIKESKLCFPQNDTFTNPIKNIIALFISEVLYRSVKETEPDKPLFDFLYNSLSFFETTKEGLANFHIVFLLHLLHYLGIYPNSESSKNVVYFDMQNGVFTNTIPSHRHFLNMEESMVFRRLLRMGFDNMSLYSFSRRERAGIINKIIEYYQLHLHDFREIKSIAVFQSLFD